MKINKIKGFALILSLSFLFIGCSKLGIGQDKSDSMENYINEDIKVLAGLAEDYNFDETSSKIVVNGIQTSYKDLTGVVDLLNLYASEKGTEATVKYKSDFKSGNLRVVLVSGNSEAFDIVKDSGEGTANVKVTGKSKVRCIGNGATGNLKIEVIFGPPQKESLPEAQFDKDGTFLLYDYKITDGNISGNLSRVYVVNRKAEKVAKIKLEGKIENGTGNFQFSDDGWGNSGYVDFQSSDNKNVQFNVKITGKKNPSSEWGFEDCTITPGDEPIPDYLKGL